MEWHLILMIVWSLYYIAWKIYLYSTSIKISYHKPSTGKIDDYPLDIIREEHDDIPAWSLSALIEMIRKLTALDLLIDGRGYRCHCRDKHEGKFYGTDDYCDTPIDACIEVILKLHEQKLL